MFNVKRLDDIRKKIHDSKILSDKEKSDWLNLLELMNDKQLGELEEILAQNKPLPEPSNGPVEVPAPSPAAAAPAQTSAPAQAAPSAAAAPVPKPAPQSNMPPLSHLANVPTGVAQQPPKPPVRPTPPPPQQPKAPTPPPASAPGRLKLTPTPEPSPTLPRKPFQMQHPEDIKDLAADSLRVYVRQNIVDAIKTAIEEHGYFQILQLLEASPLFDSYIHSGKSLLKGEQAPLTQEEFEFMTDLLSHMRFNTW